ncbi:MAG: OmpA family protein [Ignavibacteriae bacterium]|nr:OmpA family protein [Ignavibacteriota bacterium]
MVFLVLLCISADSFSQSIKKENLGRGVNTQYSEHWPVISPDGKTIYFLREDDPVNFGISGDIWYSYLQSDGIWANAIHLGAPLNSLDGGSVCSVTPDGNTLLLLGSYRKGGRIVFDGFSISRRTADGWGFPQTIVIKNFYNDNEHWSGYLSNDGKKLFTGIQRKDSYGECDIYISFLQSNNVWTEPMNLGSTINTSEMEEDAFLASDNLSLYFESKGHGGYGGFDVFMSKRLDDTWKNWSVPVNLGPEINTKKDEQEYYIDAKGEYAYFASKDNSFGDLDIFRIKLPEKVKPNPVVLVYGNVYNSKTGEPVVSGIRYEILPGGEESGTANSDPNDGSYKIILPYGKNYGFSAKADGFYSVSENMDLTGISAYKEIKKDLYLAPIEIGEVVRLNNIFFDFDKSELKQESYPELNRILKLLNDYPNIEIELSGHTDNIGKTEYNQTLSEKRAGAVAEYLFEKGISKNRVLVFGFGESKPLGSNETEQGRQKNRRVEFKIIKK